ncbi:hypothetical protein QUF76_15250 [Desulfobacterales bacterium HSG16]|nr:hypothetical protein [Desulfobacterales bacterium HSG16]
MMCIKKRLQKTIVIGTSCCGKTTFAGRLAATLQSHHIELDAIYWLPGWNPRNTLDFINMVESKTSRDNWVTDGNYKNVREIILPRATAIIWLNYTLPRVFYQAIKRTITRSWTKEALYSGNFESFQKSFFSRESILLWVLTSFNKRKRTYGKLFNEKPFPDMSYIEFRRPCDAEAFFKTL